MNNWALVANEQIASGFNSVICQPHDSGRVLSFYVLLFICTKCKLVQHHGSVIYFVVVCCSLYISLLFVVPVLVLLFVAMWFILRGDLFYVLPCFILFLCFFSSFSIAITSLGEGSASLGAFRTFVRFALVWFCLFPLPLDV